MADKEEKKKEEQEEQEPKSKGSLKRKLMIPLLPVITFVIFVLLFSNLFGVDIQMALNPPTLENPEDSTQAEVDSTEIMPGLEDLPDSIKDDIINQQNELTRLRQEVETYAENKVAGKGEDAKRLAKLYDGIDQEQLAEIFRHMEDSIIVEILPLMKTKNASGVLSKLEPVRAAKISRMIIIKE
ncbi:MAG: hypothetical protein GY855_10085 [candidate division Zixibacteria bacterium]|nr:hypothetical protein [candidate division Zixibacteria bacterium]